ncbi:MAG: GNAT family N-acetyltransferase, partial [Pseudomonadota bacterium]
PFHAHSLSEAEALLAGVPSELGDGPLIVDVPDSSEVLQDMLKTHGFTPSFETARMYSATPPDASPPPFYGVACLELG